MVQKLLSRVFFNPSVLGSIFTTSFGYDSKILLTSGRIYGGQKINGHSFHFY
ncbi:hypothetical protein E2C01_060789 [Portunus trituberculatus]|uniref:Uncharacterized protein n=1 Tax=Portunus trituberculatus TaxID=210409 RepID=A0A5B7HA08_PORTR|nr:hypothetical protein [Portunus trituberculatus]